MGVIWRSRPPGLNGRRRDELAYGTLCGAVTMLGGLSAFSRWHPATVVPVNRTMPVVITGRAQLTPDVVTLTLADPRGELLPPWSPGAHIELQLPSGRRRQYSLCGQPGQQPEYRIAVRCLADGRGGSRELHDSLTEGDSLQISSPRNAFPLATTDRNILFVIGGIGITPILPMMRVAQSRGVQWHAVYAGRSRAAMPLLGEAIAVAPDRVRVWADDEQGVPPRAEDLLANAGPSTAVYVCGPTGLLDTVRRARVDVSAGLRYERFSPGPIHGAHSFQVQLARTGTVLTVPADRSALDVMVDHDSTTPSSCRQGFCGTCKVTVIDGQVDRRGTALEGPGEMLVCVSRAAGDQVVLDA